MEKTTLIKYEDIEFEVAYALDEGCKGDWHTPPREPRAYITEIMLDKINIFDIVDAEIIEQWEEQILEEIL